MNIDWYIGNLPIILTRKTQTKSSIMKVLLVCSAKEVCSEAMLESRDKI